MSLLTWTKEQFATNISQHDREHQTIFDMVNKLHESAGGTDRSAIGKQLDALIAYVAEHFGAEESNMIKSDYADYPQHKQEHDKLVQTCLDLQKAFHAGEAEINRETTTFVADWLVNHIPNIDRRYGPAMNGAGIA
ncbi:MAG: bacteriohemerythrin [Pseudomonadota bacterium]